MDIKLRLREYRNMSTRVVETIESNDFKLLPRRTEKIMIEGVLYVVDDVIHDCDKKIIVIEAVMVGYQEGYEPYKEVKKK